MLAVGALLIIGPAHRRPRPSPRRHARRRRRRPVRRLRRRHQGAHRRRRPPRRSPLSPWLAVTVPPRSSPSTPPPAASRTARPSRSSPPPAPPPTSPASPAASSSSATRCRATRSASSSRRSPSSLVIVAALVTPPPVRAGARQRARLPGRQRPAATARDLLRVVPRRHVAAAAQRHVPRPGERRAGARAWGGSSSRSRSPQATVTGTTAGRRARVRHGLKARSVGRSRGSGRGCASAPTDLLGRHAPRARGELRRGGAADRGCAPGRADRASARATRARAEATRARARSRLALGRSRPARARRPRHAARARARARSPPPSELPATCGRSSPSSVDEAPRPARASSATIGAVGAARTRRSPAGRGAMTSRSAASRSSTGSQICQRLPMPCIEDERLPAARAMVARSMGGQPYGRAGRLPAPGRDPVQHRRKRSTNRRRRSMAMAASRTAGGTLQELAKRHLWMHFTRMGAYEDARGPDHRARRGLLRLGPARQALPRRARRAVLREHRPRPRRPRAGRRRPGEGARLLHHLVLRAPAGDRAGRARRRPRAGRPQPRVLHLRRQRGGRVRAQALPPVPQAHRQRRPLQGDLAQARLPRHDDGRAHGDRHPGRARAVRAAVPGLRHVPNTNPYRPEVADPAEAIRERIEFEGPETVAA